MYKILVFISFSLLVVFTSAQTPAKKALTPDDFATWKILPGKQISNNGKVVVFEQNPLKGDGELHIKQGSHSKTISRAYKAKISSESDFVAFNIKQPVDSVRAAKKEKVSKDKMPKDSLGVFHIKKDELSTFAKIKSFELPNENAKWVAFTLEAAKEKPDTSKKKKSIKQTGDDLFLFNPNSGDTLKMKNITEYTWAKKGSALVCIQQIKDSVGTSSVLTKFDAEKGTFSELYSTEGWIKKASLDELGEQCAFLISKDTIDEKVYTLMLAEKNEAAKELVGSKTQGLPVGWSPSINGKVYFSEDASKLYFGTAESPKEEPEDTLLAEDKPKLDIWNWKDLKLQPQQLIEAAREKKRTYLGVYHMNTQSYIQLANLEVNTVSTIQKGNGEIAFGYNDAPYKRASSWTGNRLRNYYLVDLETGIKRQFLKSKSNARLSPHGKYVIWWEPQDSSYYCQSTDINDLKIVALTKKVPVSFYDKRNDRPMDEYPFGLAGWSEDDRFVYIYDRYDIWKFDPSGDRVPVCMTKTFGRRNLTRLRYVKLDKELEFIPSGDAIMLSAFDERTMSSGYFSTKLNAAKTPDLLLMDNYRFGDLQKAKNADKLIWTKQNAKTFPDIRCGNLKFEHVKKMSDANPQQKDFVWSEVELVEWTSFKGEKLKGLLYKPENLKPDHKYPTVVYFYERSAETMHSHAYPKPSHSTINKTFYNSNDYLVFVPDITYTDGYPGQSAYDAIVSGTQYLINNFQFVDKNNIGLQGQSWGGYQIAWLITQTDLYSAAMAGAPVSNMTSAYGGIRWGSGMSRMFQYEHTQSRIGGTLWDKPLHYIENSPLFYAPKINTPLLIMSNDKDGSVPWYQGIEMFVALRRLDKPAWLLNYNGEDHNLPTKSWANRMDLSKRMFQFFNHYLKGTPAPEWMEKGVPATEKGKNLGY